MNLSNNTLTRRKFISLASAATAGVGLAANSVAADVSPTLPGAKPAQQRVFGLTAPPMDKVRIGFIGVGGRGNALLGNLLDIEGVQIKALCDIVPERVKSAARRVIAKGQAEPAAFTDGEHDYERLCEREDIDLVYIATPWDWHTPMAAHAMKHGKHAAIEVPAAMTLEECWQLVDTSEITRRHCFMLENCCYGEIELLVLRMVRQGVLGDLTHGEAGYLHQIGDYLLRDSSSANWRHRFVSTLNGNLYPTHGLGPVAMYMNINAGDQFDFLVSMSSRERALSQRSATLSEGNAAPVQEFACGDINTSLIRTVHGRTIMVQYSLVLSRPYTRINSIAGTSGTFRDYPPRLYVEGVAEDWITDLKPYHERYGHSLWKKLNAAAQASGGHGGMDFIMNWRLIQCLREGLPLDMTVYDAAAWSSIVPLSIESVAKKSAPVPIPDFTRSAWRTQPPGVLGA